MYFCQQIINPKSKIMKKLAFSLALIAFLAFGAASVQTVVAATTGIEMARMDDDKKKEDEKKATKKDDKAKKGDCATKKSCCSSEKKSGCDDDKK
jgi:hypothetical protein